MEKMNGLLFSSMESDQAASKRLTLAASVAGLTSDNACS